MVVATSPYLAAARPAPSPSPPTAPAAAPAFRSSGRPDPEFANKKSAVAAAAAAGAAPAPPPARGEGRQSPVTRPPFPLSFRRPAGGQRDPGRPVPDPACALLFGTYP